MKHLTKGEDQIFEYIEWYAVPADGFSVCNEYHFELTDEVRAQVIKRAHDLGASIAEVHSHHGPWPAAFSPSDQLGFREFVPHVWWRLKGRPYLAGSCHQERLRRPGVDNRTGGPPASEQHCR